MANEGRTEWYIKLVNTRTKKFINDDTGVFQVFTAGAANHVAIFDKVGAVATQEVSRVSYLSQTMTDGEVRFYTARTVTTVDISVLTAGGRAYFLDNVGQNTHRIDVDPDQQNWVLTALWSEGGTSTTKKPQGFQLRAGMVLHDVIVRTTVLPTGTSTTANTMDFGRSGDANGFLNGFTVSTLTIRGAVAISTTGNLVGTANQIIGADLQRSFAGGIDSTTSLGWISRHPYVANGAVVSNNLVYSRKGALTGSVTAAAQQIGEGYVYYLYTLLPGPQTGV